MQKTNFTKLKFLKLPLKQQHKKCAEILRSIYENILKKEKIDLLFEEYNKLLNFLDLPSFREESLKKISDRYHFHLKEACVFLKEHNLLPSIKTKDKKAKSEFSKNAIYLDNIRSAYNVGNILRTTEALRIGKVYFSKKTPFIDNKKVIKTSMGAFKIVPSFQNIPLKSLPRPFIALETAENAYNIFDFKFPKKDFTIILGNEEYGISDEILKEVDYIIEIPMLGCKNSINVASAFAILASQIKIKK